MHKFYALRLGLMNAAGDTSTTTSGDSVAPTVAEAVAAIENKAMPITQRLEVAFKALKGVDTTGQLAEIKTRLTTAETDLTTANARVKELEAKVTELEGKITGFEASTAQLEKENKDLAAKEQDIEKRAAAKTKEQMKTLGFPANQLPPSQDGIRAQESGSKGAYERFTKETNPEKKAALYDEYKVALAKENKAAGVGSN